MYNPTYLCRRISRELELTGKVDDPLWQTAEIAELTNPITGVPMPARTIARLLYSQQYLYLAFACEDDYIWGTFTQRDEPIFTEECVEAFICPSGKVRQYYEINVSPLNTVFDSFLLNSREPEGPWTTMAFVNYTCDGLITKVHVDGELGVPGGAKGWTVEYAIPYKSIVGGDNIIPVPGDEWRMNLYRIDAPSKDQAVHFAWGTTGKIDFHLPWRFGTLRFWD